MSRTILHGTAAALAAMILLGAAAPLGAQQTEGFGVEIRTGAAVGHVDVSGASFSPSARLAWSVGGTYAVLPLAQIYLGYDRSPFTCAEEFGDGEETFCAGEVPSFLSHGLTAEGRLVLPLGPVRPWLGLGTGVRIFASEVAGTRRASDPALSLTASAGAELPLGRHIAVAPGFRFATHAHQTDGPWGGRERISVVSGDLGIRYRF